MIKTVHYVKKFTTLNIILKTYDDLCHIYNI